MKDKLNIIKKWLIIIVQIVVSGLFIYTCYNVALIPQSYIILGTLFLSGLIVGEYFLIFYKKEKSKRSLITQLLSIVLSGVLLMGSSYLYQIGKVVNLLAEDSFQKRAISVIVLEDSEIRNQNQLPHHKIGYMSFVDKENMDYAVDVIQKEVGEISVTDHEDFHALVEAFYNKEVDAIILDEAFRSLIEEEHETFTDDTRVVYQVTKEESHISAKSVDVTTKPFLVFISGNDTYGEMEAVSRSDVNMLAAINPTTHQILLVSIPRDTYVPLHRNGMNDKFTHTGMYGLQESINTLEDLINEEINYYVRMNFTSFINVIDALGGITVYSPREFVTIKGHYTIKKGENTLNAKQALSFVRERKAFADGDFMRGRNQQRMIVAIVDKVSSPAILSSFSSIMDIVSESFDMNFTREDMNAFVQMQLSEMPSWDIQMYQIKGYPTMKPCYSSGSQPYSVVVPYDNSIEEARQYIDDLMQGKIIKVETTNEDEQ